jgi:hypothetical protein
LDIGFEGAEKGTHQGLAQDKAVLYFGNESDDEG